MNDELRSKVLEDLEESGLGSEMKAIRAFLDHKWLCTGGVSFFDRDGQQTREIDLQASRILRNGSINCHYVIVGEVKKTIKPWVVFKRPASPS